MDVAPNGNVGLANLLGAHCDAALLNVALGGIDGISLCRAAREAGIATPLLIVTQRAATEDRIRGIEAGANDYLITPFADEELRRRLRALLRAGH